MRKIISFLTWVIAPLYVFLFLLIKWLNLDYSPVLNTNSWRGVMYTTLLIYLLLFIASLGFLLRICNYYFGYNPSIKHIFTKHGARKGIPGIAIIMLMLLIVGAQALFYTFTYSLDIIHGPTKYSGDCMYVTADVQFGTLSSLGVSPRSGAYPNTYVRAPFIELPGHNGKLRISQSDYQGISGSPFNARPDYKQSDCIVRVEVEYFNLTNHLVSLKY